MGGLEQKRGRKETVTVSERTELSVRRTGYGAGGILGLPAALLLILFLFLGTGCGFEKAPGEVLRPAVETHGHVVFTMDWQRQGTRDEDQFALWVEDMDGKYLRTVSVTHRSANAAWDGKAPEKDELPHWREMVRAQNLSQYKDVTVMGVDTPPTGKVTYVWYGDTDYGGKAFPPGQYRYILEARHKDSPEQLYSGTFRIGDSGNISYAKRQNPVDSPLVEGLSAEFVPARERFFGIGAIRDRIARWLRLN